MILRNSERLEQERIEIIERFHKEGIKVKIGIKSPVNGRYSGIVGSSEKILRINLPR